MIDLYCERVNPGYFDEPVNALSNIAFLIAAVYAWRYSKRHSVEQFEINLLIVMMVAIGLGSLSFHVFANRISQLADLLPVFLFQLLYLWVYTNNVWKFSWPMRVVMLLLLLSSIFISSLYDDFLNGSLLYAPTLTVLLIISLYHSIISKPEAGLAITAAIIFVLSLIFRTIDNELCEAVTTGSHFMWHLLNGVVIYQMFKLLVFNRARVQSVL